MRTFLALPCLSLVLAAQTPIPLPAPLASVKLYPDEAWATRIGRGQVASGGTHRLLLAGLPPGLTLDDVQVSAKGPAGSRLGDVSLSQDTLAVEESPAWTQLQADREALQDKVDGLESQVESLRREITFLETVQATQSSETGAKLTTAPPNAGPLLAFGEGVQGRLGQLLLQERRLKRDLARLAVDRQRLEDAQARLRGQARTAPSQALVELTTPAGGPIEILLSYRVRQARWQPAYEARLSEDHKTLDLALYAAVTQRSGEDWTGVRLEISNARPSRNLDLPRFGAAQSVGWMEGPPPPAPAPGPVYDGSTAMMVSSGPSNGYVYAPRRAKEAIAVDLPVAQASEALLQTASGLAVDFRLNGAKDVPSDGDPHRFRLMDQVVDPGLALIATPRLDPAVYQVARFQAPGTLPIFPGAPMVQYLGGQRLGQAPLRQPAAGQPYQLGFGPLQGLRVTVRPTEHKLETVGAFTKERQWTLRDRFDLTSELPAPVDVEVQDRLLKATIDSVKVTDLPETTPGARETQAGVRTWTLHLAPGQTNGVTVATQVRAPKEGLVTGLALEP
ncbi:MAG TPA: mucoidy inhibitor MuiA family protein [Holophagaceae bacterium]|nr:mucoidy inhibitor MuiA family protein [Holophagaceae bacterium]